MTDHKKRRFFSVIFLMILFALTLLGMECISYLYIQQNINRNSLIGVTSIPSPRQIIDQIDSEWLAQYYLTTFNETLGWEPKPNAKKTEINTIGKEVQWAIDELGARRNPKFNATLLPYIAAFGDSFTFGAEVNDDQSWEYYLSLTLTRYVANYGVGGYGTDQALLRYKEKLDEGLRPNFALLGIYHENFKRVLNRFRPFYNVNTGIKLGFKPRAYLDGSGNLLYLPSALREKVWDRKQLTKLIEFSRENDFWANYRPWKEFPFLANIMRAFYLKSCKTYQSIPTCDSLREPDWNSPPVKAIMNALIQEFIQISNHYHIQPAILFLSFGKHSPYSSFIAEIRKEKYTQGIMIIDITDADFDRTKARIKPNRGHLSPQGNKAVADHIRQYFPKAHQCNKPNIC